MRKLKVIALAAIAIGSLQLAAATGAFAGVTACSASITSCGCTITAKGTYTVANALNASQGLTPGNACIDVKAANVFLFLNDFDLTGSGSGFGIHLLKTAKNTFVEGRNDRIDHWNIGIQDDASNSIAEDFSTEDNAAAGIVMNHVSGSNINDFTSDSNPIGVMLVNSNNNLVGCFDANSNSNTGVKLINSNNNKIECFSADDNTVYGVWLFASSNNQVDCSNTNGNGNTGIYAGCNTAGATGNTCGGVGPSKNNRLYDHDADTNTVAGIAIDLGDTGNVVTDTSDTTNHGADDLIDENPNCDSNLWIGNSFTHSNMTCIH